MNFQEDQDLAFGITLQTDADKAEFGKCVYKDMKNDLYSIYVILCGERQMAAIWL
jgi:hypothetical protein